MPAMNKLQLHKIQLVSSGKLEAKEGKTQIIQAWKGRDNEESRYLYYFFFLFRNTYTLPTTRGVSNTCIS